MRKEKPWLGSKLPVLKVEPKGLFIVGTTHLAQALAAPIPTTEKPAPETGTM